jgi:hypothetical protein
MEIPCGRCMSCRLNRASQWSTRITHEASLHQSNSFITLTYSDTYLPSDLALSVREIQLFIKRLRKALPQQIRYVLCGEYGSKTYRPHYHAILFGVDFSADRYRYKTSKTGHPLYRSPTLEAAWPFGYCDIGAVTPLSAGYVARYTTKKVYGDNDAASEAYTRERVGPDGVLTTWQVPREFLLMSRGGRDGAGGIGGGWLKKYHSDAFPSDFVVIDGQKRSVPQYYRKKLLEIDESEAERLARKRRKEAAQASRDELTRGPGRELERMEFQLAKAKRFEREPES